NPALGGPTRAGGRQVGARGRGARPEGANPEALDDAQDDQQPDRAWKRKEGIPCAGNQQARDHDRPATDTVGQPSRGILPGELPDQRGADDDTDQGVAGPALANEDREDREDRPEAGLRDEDRGDQAPEGKPPPSGDAPAQDLAAEAILIVDAIGACLDFKQPLGVEETSDSDQ